MIKDNNINLLINPHQPSQGIKKEILAAKKILECAKVDAKAILEESSRTREELINQSISTGFETGMALALKSLISLPEIKKSILEDIQETIVEIIRKLSEELLLKKLESNLSEDFLKKRILELINNLTQNDINNSKTILKTPKSTLPQVENILKKENINLKVEENDENSISIYLEDGISSYCPKVHLEKLITKIKILVSNSTTFEEIVEKETALLKFKININHTQNA